jgi:hypothetical protein
MGIFSKSKPKPTRAEALEKFKTTIRDAIGEARAAGIWPVTISDHLEIHVANLAMQEMARQQ